MTLTEKVENSPPAVGLVADYINNIHPVANLNPLMTEEQFRVFKQGVSLDGQLDRIYIYRGKVVDGRNRLRALSELGVTMVKMKILPHKLTIEDLERIVKLTEDRRHESKTQLAINVYNAYTSGYYKSQAEAIEKGVVSKTNFETIIWLSKHGPRDLLVRLFNGEFIKLTNGVRTDNLVSIKKDIQAQKHNEEEAKEKGGSKDYALAYKQIELMVESLGIQNFNREGSLILINEYVVEALKEYSDSKNGILTDTK